MALADFNEDGYPDVAVGAVGNVALPTRRKPSASATGRDTAPSETTTRGMTRASARVVLAGAFLHSQTF
jgi:hypothetical protein